MLINTHKSPTNLPIFLKGQYNNWKKKVQSANVVASIPTWDNNQDSQERTIERSKIIKEIKPQKNSF